MHLFQTSKNVFVNIDTSSGDVEFVNISNMFQTQIVGHKNATWLEIVVLKRKQTNLTRGGYQKKQFIWSETGHSGLSSLPASIHGVKSPTNEEGTAHRGEKSLTVS